MRMHVKNEDKIEWSQLSNVEHLETPPMFSLSQSSRNIDGQAKYVHIFGSLNDNLVRKERDLQDIYTSCDFAPLAKPTRFKKTIERNNESMLWKTRFQKQKEIKH